MRFFDNLIYFRVSRPLASLVLSFMLVLDPPSTSCADAYVCSETALPPSLPHPEEVPFLKASPSSDGRRRPVTAWIFAGAKSREIQNLRCAGLGALEGRRNNHRRGIQISMKAKARRPRGGREPGGRGGSVVATGRRARGKTTLYIEVDDLASDAWR